MRTLTRDRFEEFKADYVFYGTHTALDRYNNESRQKDTEPKCTVHTMWHPLTDAVSIAEYGADISKVLFAIIYDQNGITYGDYVTVNGDEYEVVAVKQFNSHYRVDIKKKKA